MTARTMTFADVKGSESSGGGSGASGAGKGAAGAAGAGSASAGAGDEFRMDLATAIPEDVLTNLDSNNGA